MILFHGTNAEFETFQDDFLNSREDGHVNGAMGVWLSPDPRLASSFGRWLLAVEVPDSRIYDMPLQELIQLARLNYRDETDSLVRHQEFANGLRSEGFDLVTIREENGSADTLIALHPERCVIVGRASTSDPSSLDALLDQLTAGAPTP